MRDDFCKGNYSLRSVADKIGIPYRAVLEYMAEKEIPPEQGKETYKRLTELISSIKE